MDSDSNKKVPDFSDFRFILDTEGIPYTIVQGAPIDPEHKRAVDAFIEKVEQAHTQAGNSPIRCP